MPQVRCARPLHCRCRKRRYTLIFVSSRNILVLRVGCDSESQTEIQMAARPNLDTIEELAPGTRVRLTSAGIGVTLRSPYGTIVGPDRWLDYYVIRLDEPADFDEGLGEQEQLSEICEMPANFIVLPPVE